MKVKQFLDKVAYLGDQEIEGFEPSRVYFSKFDDSYITHVGMEKQVKYLADKEITDELTHGVGFSPKDNKWYGWSHRAIFGFTIGSECKKGHCHYHGATLEDQEQAAIDFWADDCHEETKSNGIVEEDGEKFFDIVWKYNSKVPNEKLRETIGGAKHHIKPLGRGEWTAKTLEDAKLMAIDFNEGVSQPGPRQIKSPY